MSKGFKISLLVIFLIFVGYMVPVFLVDGYSWGSPLEKEVENMLSPVENVLVLKIIDDGQERPEAATLYTWFGFKYGVFKKIGYCSGDFCTRSWYEVRIDRFWTKNDIMVYQGESIGLNSH